MPTNSLEEYGVEDPRITLIDGVYHITYVAVSRLGITTVPADHDGLPHVRAARRDACTPTRRTSCCSPRRWTGRYLAFTRPMPGSFGRVLGLWLAESDDLVHWGRHRPVALPRPGCGTRCGSARQLVPIRDGRRLARDVPRRRPRRTATAWARCCWTRTIPRRCSRARTRPIMVPEAPLRARRLPARRRVPERARRAGRRR